MAHESQYLNVEACTGIVRQAMRSRWPETDGCPGEIRPAFWARLDQRIVYCIAEEVARTRKHGLIGGAQ